MIRSTFFGIEIAKTGLFTSQKALDVTGHNIANVDTPGYTRQRLVTSAVDPYNTTLRFKPVERGLVGAGVKVNILDQIRDVFLDKQFRNEQTSYSNWATRTQGLNYVEALFEEEDDTSLRSTLVSFFNSFDKIVQNPSDPDQRTYVRAEAQKLIANLNHVYNRLADMHADQNKAVETTVRAINTAVERIAILNKSIKSFEEDGQPANDLRDKRNLLLDELSSLIDIDYEIDGDNNFILRIGDVGGVPVEVLNHTTQTPVTFLMGTNPLTGANDIYIPTVDGLNPLHVNGGELLGHLELRDNDAAKVTTDGLEPGIPYFIEQINRLAQALVKEVNAIHKQGWTLPHNGNPSDTDVAFFDDTLPLSSVTAGNIKLSDAILQSVYNIAASGEEIDLSSPGGAKAGNQLIAKDLAALINNTTLDDVGSFHAFLTSVATDLATTLGHSKNMTTTQGSLVLNVDNQRLSISGVSLDEEMTNLLKYQHAYAGASRVITTMDEAIDILINKMGLVGR